MAGSLQIKLLSERGEVLSVINCPGGHISVFRANTHSELQPYQRALAGIPGPERFAIELDRRDYQPQEHLLIGFGEERQSIDATVAEYFQKFISAEALRPLLLSYGLEQTIDRQMNSLTACEDRRLALLAATYQPDKVLVLSDPFDPIAGSWRERFAELLSAHVKASGRICVVTNLSYRPDHWVENTTILRIQVGEELQKTIGFGQKAEEIQAVIKKMRSTEAQDAKIRQSEAGQKTPRKSDNTATASTAPRKNSRTVARFRRYMWWASGGTVALLAVLLVLSNQQESGDPSLLDPNLSQVKNDVGSGSSDNKQTKDVSNIKTATPSAQPTAADKLVGGTTVATPISSNFLLDSYPPEIKRSIIKAFDSAVAESTIVAPSSNAQKRGNWAAEPPAIKQNAEAGGLLSALALASGSGDRLPSQPSASSPPANYPALDNSPITSEMTDQEREERREMIRQKFLEAISKASENR